MRFRIPFAAAAVAAAFLVSNPALAGERITIELKTGPVVIELADDVAPKHAERIRTLAADGAYDNVAFHRVIEGFMAQTGDVAYGNLEKGFDPYRVGSGDSKYPNLPAEFSDVPFERGTVGMARSDSPDSANSQFFIMFAPAPHLEGNYTAVGKVVSGMENVDQIKRGRGPNGMVSDPDRMITVKSGG